MTAFNAMGEKPKPSSLESADLCEPFSEPLNTVEDFKVLEGILNDAEFKSRMITFLSLIGGSKLSQTGRRVMQKLRTNHLWSKFNILGRKGKRSLKATKFFPVIVRACMKNHEGTTEPEVEEVIGDYLKRTPFLPGGNKHKKVPTVPVLDVSNDDIDANDDVEDMKY
ncbi:uncharacterized protein LOC121419762 [Lytechinus variegatus]|uniref:uncharacterized protein LOC121419762 n=1 Tax=Lytechinus variegatus TaxID=7654 RepID=UPI001BB1F992|nr:uncharacterized protein LOC121419762 [Lytechinus variegatus]